MFFLEIQNNNKGPAMNRSRMPSLLLGALSAALCGGLIGINVALADVPEGALQFGPDGKLEFEVRDTPRREVFERLFAGSGIEVKWVAAAFGDERVGGKFSGTPASVIRQLLSQTNFVVVHDGDTSRVIRLVVVGPAKGDQSFSGVAALAAAIKPVATAKEAKPETTGGAPAQPAVPKSAAKPQVAAAAAPPPAAPAPAAAPAAPAPAAPAAAATPLAAAAPAELPKTSALDVAPARPGAPETPLKPSAADVAAAPVDLPKVSSLETPTPEGQNSLVGRAAEPQGGAPIALSELDRGADASGILKPPPEGVTAPVLVLPEGAKAPPLLAPPEGMMAMPLSPPAPGAVPPELKPVPGTPDK
jgi:hypothetical protein